MIRYSQRIPAVVTLSALLAGCGAAASLPPASESSKLAGRLSEAVWYAEKGDQELTAAPADHILAEDGVARPDSILVVPAKDDSTYIQGVFSISVPDQETVRLTAKVGFPAETSDQAVFRAYIQDGASFPMLAEVTAVSDGRLDDMNIDLSAYRGQNILLILSLSSADGAQLPSAALWVQPQLVTY